MCVIWCVNALTTCWHAKLAHKNAYEVLRIVIPGTKSLISPWFACDDGVELVFPGSLMAGGELFIRRTQNNKPKSDTFFFKPNIQKNVSFFIFSPVWQYKSGKKLIYPS